MQANLNQQIILTIVHPNKIQQIAVNSRVLEMPLYQITKLISDTIGYSSRIYPYILPLSSISSLKHIDSNQTLKSCLKQYPNLCFTYNNTQFTEQSEFRNKQQAFFGLTKMPIVIVLQICQNNAFVDEKYNIPQDYDINSVKAITSRYGRSIFAQYQTIRINLNRFGGKQKISDCLKQLVDEHNRLLLYVSNRDQTTEMVTIKGKLSINRSKYIQMHMEGYQQRFLLCRNTNWKIIKYMLQVIFQAQLYVLNPISDTFIRLAEDFTLCENQQLIIMQKAKSSFINLKTPLEYSYLLGNKDKLIYILTKSHILHIYQCSHQIQLKSTFILHKPQSEIDDEDIAFIQENKIIFYNISIYYISISYFRLNGKFLFTKRYPWNKDYLVQYDIERSVIDILFVKLKSKKQQYGRFFYITNPENFVEINTPQQVYFYPARVGLNKFSDGSGHIAITINARKTTFYNLKKSVNEVCFLQHLQKPLKIIFGIWNQQNTKRKIAIFYSKFIDIIQIDFKTGSIEFIQQKQMNTTRKNANYLFTFENELTLFDVAMMHQNDSSSRIGEGVILINDSSKNQNLAMMKENPYLLKHLVGFYKLKT